MRRRGTKRESVCAYLRVRVCKQESAHAREREIVCVCACVCVARWSTAAATTTVAISLMSSLSPPLPFFGDASPRTGDVLDFLYPRPPVVGFGSTPLGHGRRRIQNVKVVAITYNRRSCTYDGRLYTYAYNTRGQTHSCACERCNVCVLLA